MRLTLPLLRLVPRLPLHPTSLRSTTCFARSSTLAHAKMATVAETTRKALRKQMFIGGKFVDADGGATFDVTDPCTGGVLAPAAAASSAQVDAAVKAAAAAFPAWAKLTDAERAGWLRKLADELASRKPHVAAVEALNTGKPFREAEGDVDDACAAFRYCAGLAEHGKGVAHIQPDQSALPDPNFAGSSIIYEPLCAAAEAVGLPAGVINVVTGAGAIGAELTTHPLVDKVTFTGSVPTGSKVMGAASAGVKRVTLELGGKSPAIVFNDANLDAATEWIFFGAFWNTGQICSATSRVLVQEGVAEELTARLVKAAATLKQGTPFEEGVEIGPSCNAMQYAKVQAYIAKTKEEGAQLLLGGGRPQGERFATGFWTAPTIFKVTPNNTIFREEIFGPVMSITTFKTAEEALALANDTSYGLAAAAFSEDKATLERCATELRAGVVWLNNAQPSPHAMPWGGFKKSGIGREMGPLALLPFLEPKAVTRWAGTEGVGWYADFGARCK